MKNSLAIILGIFSLFLISCDSDNDKEEIVVRKFSFTDFPQEWKLVGVRSAMIPNAEVEKDLDYNESYTFYEDHTFQKKSNVEGEVHIAEGVFSINDSEIIMLEYGEESNLIANCSSRSKIENLNFSEDQLVNGSWVACDGPYLYYKRIE
ncbi:hypothetical protein [Zunongwangia sp.]|uniref:hypothetical protein n=1 Tax=Zunongwangia sp. TaxID=1965325 RepID=UPI003AA96AF1